VRGILALRDFWLINAYFTVYVALCHAFDAVEGSLLEHYGYSASLCSWTGISCGVASVFVSILESRYLVDASSHKPALAVSSVALVIALAMAFVCLQFRMHDSVFVVAIGIFGMSVPAWGCSCELGSEVCYPAREATVSSILEACSNLAGVASIIASQRLLDSGYGASVLLLMALMAVVAAALLLCITGRLRRSEAEEAELAGEAVEEVELRHLTPMSDGSMDDTPASREERDEKERLPEQASVKTKVGKGLVSMIGMLVLGRFLIMIPLGQLPEEFADSLSEVSPVNRTRLNGAKPAGLLRNGLPEPRSFVIHCEKETSRMARFRKHMAKAQVDFSVVLCSTGSQKSVSAAVREGLLPRSAQKATRGKTRQGLERANLIAVAISHLKVLKMVAESDSKEHMLANIFEDTEVVSENFRKRRNQLLGRLPHYLELVKLNVLRPAGVRLSLGNASEWMYGKVFRLRGRTSPLMNLWLSNYVVTRRGAQRILEIGRTFDTFGSWEMFDVYVLAHLYGASGRKGLHAFSVQTGVMSTHCDSSRLCYRVTDKNAVHPATISRCKGTEQVHPLCKMG